MWLGPPHLLKHELLDELSVVLTAVARVVGRDPLSTQDRRSVCVCDVCMCVCVCVCVCVVCVCVCVHACVRACTTVDTPHYGTTDSDIDCECAPARRADLVMERELLLVALHRVHCTST